MKKETFVLWGEAAGGCGGNGQVSRKCYGMALVVVSLLHYDLEIIQ
jgi:hypothetical protein